MSEKPDRENDDIVIPEVEITRGWVVSDLETLADCDEALTFLTGAIASIEAQLASHKAGLSDRDEGWQIKVQTALTWRKHAREMVTRRRAAIASSERRAVIWLREHHPELWNVAVDAVTPNVIEV